MKWSKLVFVAVMMYALHSAVVAQHHHGSSWSSSKKDPAIAAALSLQPLPVDLGSFYAGNWERGILYTAAEMALLVPAVILIAENSSWGHHRYDYYPYNDPSSGRGWTTAERERFYYFLGGYLLVKVISAFDAGFSVERENKGLSFRYDPQSKSLSLGVSVAIR